jgi:hypothetical protein
MAIIYLICAIVYLIAGIINIYIAIKEMKRDKHIECGGEGTNIPTPRNIEWDAVNGEWVDHRFGTID